MNLITRREFLQKAGLGAGAAALLSSSAYAFLKPIVGVDNPLETQNRGQVLTWLKRKGVGA